MELQLRMYSTVSHACCGECSKSRSNRLSSNSLLKKKPQLEYQTTLFAGGNNSHQQDADKVHRNTGIVPEMEALQYLPLIFAITHTHVWDGGKGTGRRRGVERKLPYLSSRRATGDGTKRVGNLPRTGVLPLADEEVAGAINHVTLIKSAARLYCKSWADRQPLGIGRPWFSSLAARQASPLRRLLY